MKHVRPIRIDGDIAYITLTQEYEAIINAADLHIADGFNWHAWKSGRTIYVVRTVWIGGGKTKKIYLHRAIIGPHEDLLVDHIDGNGLNNLRSNLRLATRAQNQHNRGVQVNNTSGIKGVSWDKRSHKWQAAIRANHRQIHLGYYQTVDEAGEAYASASAKYHGEFARTA